MLSNNDITYYSKSLDSVTKLEIWTKTIFEDVWEYGRKSSNVNVGYESSNAIDVRIPIEKVDDINLFKIGDIIAIGEQGDIEKQSDLVGTEFYNVTSISINNFGNNPHIHLGGR